MLVGEQENKAKDKEIIVIEKRQEDIPGFDMECEAWIEEGSKCRDKREYTEAMKWFQKTVERSYPRGWAYLAQMYTAGLGCKEDQREASRFFSLAAAEAKKGNMIAHFSIARMYYYGHGVGRDYKEAVKWYEKVAEQGHAVAQCNLGLCYDFGHGVAQDYKKAVMWYKRAIEQGSVIAQNNLGTCYRYGRGVRRDHEEAIKWYTKAAKQGLLIAQNNLNTYHKKAQQYERVKSNTSCIQNYHSNLPVMSASSTLSSTGQGLSQSQNSLTIFHPSRKKTLQQHTEDINALVFFEKNNRTFVISGSSDNTIKVCKLNSDGAANCVAVLQGHTNDINALRVVKHQHKVLIISGSGDTTIRVWKVGDNDDIDCVVTLTGHTGYVESLAVLKDEDNTFLVSGSGDKTIKLWQFKDDDNVECVATLQGHKDGVYALATIKKSGTVFIISGSSDKTIKVWQMEGNGNAQCVMTVRNTGQVYALAVLQQTHNTFIISGNKNGIVMVWKVENDNNIQCVATLHKHKNSIYTIAIIKESDNVFFITGSSDKTIKLWQFKDDGNAQCVATKYQDNVVYTLTVLKRGNNTFIASGNEGGNIHIWQSMPWSKQEMFSIPYRILGGAIPELPKFPSRRYSLSTSSFSETGSFLGFNTIKLKQIKDLKKRDSKLSQIPYVLQVDGEENKPNIDMTLYTKRTIKQDDKIIFVFAGSNNEMFIPPIDEIQSSTLRIIIVIAATQYNDFKNYIQTGLDILCIKQLKSPTHGNYNSNLNAINTCKIAALIFAMHLQNKFCIKKIVMANNNITMLHYAKEENNATEFDNSNDEVPLSRQWEAFYNELDNHLTEQEGSVCMSITTPSEEKMQMGAIKTNLGSSIFMIDLEQLGQKITNVNDAFYLFFPASATHYFGEDYFFQIFLNRLFDNQDGEVTCVIALSGKFLVSHARESQKVALEEGLIDCIVEREVKSYLSEVANDNKLYARLYPFAIESFSRYKAIVAKNKSAWQAEMDKVKNANLSACFLRVNRIVSNDKLKEKIPPINRKDFLNCLQESIKKLITLKDETNQTLIRGHQKHILIQAIQSMNEEGKISSGLFEMATGTGKTYLQIYLAIAAYLTGDTRPVFIVTPYQQLVEQAYQDFINVIECESKANSSSVSAY